MSTLFSSPAAMYGAPSNDNGSSSSSHHTIPLIIPSPLLSSTQPLQSDFLSTSLSDQPNESQHQHHHQHDDEQEFLSSLRDASTDENHHHDNNAVNIPPLPPNLPTPPGYVSYDQPDTNTNRHDNTQSQPHPHPQYPNQSLNLQAYDSGRQSYESSENHYYDGSNVQQYAYSNAQAQPSTYSHDLMNTSSNNEWVETDENSQYDHSANQQQHNTHTDPQYHSQQNYIQRSLSSRRALSSVNLPGKPMTQRVASSPSVYASDHRANLQTGPLSVPPYHYPPETPAAQQHAVEISQYNPSTSHSQILRAEQQGILSGGVIDQKAIHAKLLELQRQQQILLAQLSQTLPQQDTSIVQQAYIPAPTHQQQHGIQSSATYGGDVCAQVATDTSSMYKYDSYSSSPMRSSRGSHEYVSSTAGNSEISSVVSSSHSSSDMDESSSLSQADGDTYSDSATMLMQDVQQANTIGDVDVQSAVPVVGGLRSTSLHHQTSGASVGSMSSLSYGSAGLLGHATAHHQRYARSNSKSIATPTQAVVLSTDNDPTARLDDDGAGEEEDDDGDDGDLNMGGKNSAGIPYPGVRTANELDRLGKRIYYCEACNKPFNHKGTLRRHLRIHTGEKPFECSICQRAFNQKIALITHLRTHTGEKPFKCTSCNQRFAYKNNLTAHLRKHSESGEKPFICHVCDKAFGYRGTLERHRKSHNHPSESETASHSPSLSSKSALAAALGVNMNPSYVNGGHKVYKCEIGECTKKFSKKEFYLQHVLAHAAKKDKTEDSASLHTPQNLYKLQLQHAKALRDKHASPHHAHAELHKHEVHVKREEDPSQASVTHSDTQAAAASYPSSTSTYLTNSISSRDLHPCFHHTSTRSSRDAITA